MSNHALHEQTTTLEQADGRRSSSDQFHSGIKTLVSFHAIPYRRITI